MSEGNPVLVAEPRTGLTSGVVGTGSIDKDATGTGLFSDAANAIRDGADGNWGGLAVDAVAGGLDYLSFVEDPLQGLLSAGIGWLIDHISFLSEPLDYLAGNADLVTEKAQTWKNISQALQRSSQDYTASAQALTAQYTGPASSAYAASAKNFADLVATTGKHADNAATAMTVAGAIVGTTRGIVRDLISQFVAQAVEKWIITAATSWLDFGASIPIFIGDEVYEASNTAERVAGKLTQLAKELKELEDAARNGAKGLDTTIAAVKRSIRSEGGWVTRSTREAAADGGHLGAHRRGPVQGGRALDASTPTTSRRRSWRTARRARTCSVRSRSPSSGTRPRPAPACGRASRTPPAPSPTCSRSWRPLTKQRRHSSAGW